MLHYVCLIFVTSLASVHCIPCQQRTVEVEVPSSVKIGDSATLICNVKPKNEEDHLINVRWYKENEEFYRFTPDDTPPIKQFPVPGITVDAEKSSVKTVVLKNVQNQLTANYSCQASWTVPNIATAKDSKEMFVVDELKGEIILTVENENPGYNEQLMGVCITPPSKIAPKITWFLNGYQVYSWSSQRARQNSNVPKRFTSFFNQRASFLDDRANITCIVEVDNIYKAQKSIVLKRNPHIGRSYYPNRVHGTGTDIVPYTSGSPMLTINMSIFATILVHKLWVLF
ncbi:uncharacterized protein LOC126890392 isoform X2 [Diabrotica virgifera virgifera]|uniref:Ig-like domain-containing protein n=1 Tax=Diabrotica virgifera virgifera TaxID=50390 RepID=A0ABM5KYH7_DIAVI|nr:uncharacterized protein LOC126890392 isoform X2 [Diabrotica virgifera virgifera]